MARVGDRWLDGGHRVPGYVADTLAESPQPPGDRRGRRCWSHEYATRRYIAVCGAGVIATSLTTPHTSDCARCGASLRRHRGPAAPGRGSTVSRNGGGGRWEWIARMW